MIRPTLVPITTDHGFDTRETWDPPAVVAPDLVPTIREDLRRLDAFLERSCGKDHARLLLGQIAALTKSRDEGEKASTARLNAMANMLAGYPEAIVTTAAREYSRRETWFPTLAELVKLIEPELARYAAQRHRLAQLLTKAGTAQPAEHPPDTPEQRAAGLALIAAARRRLAGKATPEDIALLRSRGLRTDQVDPEHA